MPRKIAFTACNNPLQSDMRVAYLMMLNTICLLAAQCKEKGEIAPATLVSLTASSVLQPSSGKYRAENLVDGNPLTAWVEGKADDGIGEFVDIEFDRSQSVDSVGIVTGYGDPRYWQRNNRVKQIDITNEKGVTHRLDLRDTIELQQLRFPQQFSFQKLRLRINSVFRGTHDRDTCISEITIGNVRPTAPSTAEAPKAQYKGSWTLVMDQATGSTIVTLTLDGKGQCTVSYEDSTEASGGAQSAATRCEYHETAQGVKVQGKMGSDFAWDLLSIGDDLQVNSKKNFFYFVQFGDTFTRDK